MNMMKGEKFHHNYFPATEVFGVIIQSDHTLYFTSTCFSSGVDTNILCLDYPSGLTLFSEGVNLGNGRVICGIRDINIMYELC